MMHALGAVLNHQPCLLVSPHTTTDNIPRAVLFERMRRKPAGALRAKSECVKHGTDSFLVGMGYE